MRKKEMRMFFHRLETKNIRNIQKNVKIFGASNKVVNQLAYP